VRSSLVLIAGCGGTGAACGDAGTAPRPTTKAVDSPRKFDRLPIRRCRRLLSPPMRCACGRDRPAHRTRLAGDAHHRRCHSNFLAVAEQIDFPISVAAGLR